MRCSNVILPTGEKIADYWICKSGQLYRLSTGQNITPKQGNPYKRINIKTKDGFKVFRLHQLMLSTYSRLPKAGEVSNHKDGNKLNNHIDNLEYISQKENVLHAKELGLMSEFCMPVVLKDMVTGEIHSFRSQADAARLLQFNQASLSEAISKSKGKIKNYLILKPRSKLCHI